MDLENMKCNSKDVILKTRFSTINANSVEKI